MKAASEIEFFAAFSPPIAAALQVPAIYSVWTPAVPSAFGKKLGGLFTLIR